MRRRRYIPKPHMNGYACWGYYRSSQRSNMFHGKCRFNPFEVLKLTFDEIAWYVEFYEDPNWFATSVRRLVITSR